MEMVPSKEYNGMDGGNNCAVSESTAKFSEMPKAYQTQELRGINKTVNNHNGSWSRKNFGFVRKQRQLASAG